MRTRFLSLLATGALVALVLTIPPGAEAQPTPAPLAPQVVAQLPPNFSYAQREQTASPAIRAKLATLRQQIQASKLPYTVGYTTALDRPLSALTGLTLPTNMAQKVAAQAPVQAMLLQADEAQRLQYIKTHPNVIVRPETPPFSASAPRADWRTYGKVTPIRDQGHCGSCWAFAAIGAYESSYLIRNNISSDTSEQAMLSCSGAGNCGGGWPGPAFDWLIANGTDKEVDYPYTATNGVTGACHGFTAEYKAAAWGFVKPSYTQASVAEIKQALATYGPILAGVQATAEFQAYTGGVFYQAVPANALNHAVVLVGWDENQVGPNGAKGAWIMRNSWGTGWGTVADYGSERGYMYLAYNSSNVGTYLQWVRAPSNLYLVNPRIQEIIKAPSTAVKELTPIRR
jgi:cathepsin L